MIEYSIPLLVIALACYIGARFAFLAGWPVITGALRLLGLWTAACWFGYATPLYVALLCLPLGVLWSFQLNRLPALVLVELAFAALLVWHSAMTPVAIYLVALILFDQLAARLLIARYDRQQDPNVRMHRLIVVMASIAVSALVWHYYRAPINSYVADHSIPKFLGLAPQGAAPLWFHKRTLNGPTAGAAQVGSVYWEARYPETSERCLISFHGASAFGSLQSTSRTLAQSAARSGLRMFAVDHPGFGASPTPPPSAPVDAWDPAHLTAAVLSQMRLSNCDEIVALGHSQGVTEALRALTGNTADVSRVLVLGAGLYSDEPDQDDYWYSRFHIDRKLTQQIDRGNWELIRDLYYLNQEYCSDTAAGKGYRDIKPLQFVQFAQEHANLVATRDTLWNCLDYPSKDRVELPTNHYLNSLHVGAMTFVHHASPQIAAVLFPVQADIEGQADEI